MPPERQDRPGEEAVGRTAGRAGSGDGSREPSRNRTVGEWRFALLGVGGHDNVLESHPCQCGHSHRLETLQHVALALSVFMNAEGKAWPSIMTLSDSTHRNRKSVSRALWCLHGSGVLFIEENQGSKSKRDSGAEFGGQRPHLYRASLPDAYLSAQPTRQGSHEPGEPEPGLGFTRSPKPVDRVAKASRQGLQDPPNSKGTAKRTAKQRTLGQKVALEEATRVTAERIAGGWDIANPSAYAEKIASEDQEELVAMAAARAVVGLDYCQECGGAGRGVGCERCAGTGRDLTDEVAELWEAVR